MVRQSKINKRVRASGKLPEIRRREKWERKRKIGAEKEEAEKRKLKKEKGGIKNNGARS